MRVVQPGSFEKDFKKPKKRGKELDKLKVIVDLLVARTTAGITFRPEERGGSGQRSNFSRRIVEKTDEPLPKNPLAAMGTDGWNPGEPASYPLMATRKNKRLPVPAARPDAAVPGRVQN